LRPPVSVHLTISLKKEREVGKGGFLCSLLPTGRKEEIWEREFNYSHFIFLPSSFDFFQFEAEEEKRPLPKKKGGEVRLIWGAIFPHDFSAVHFHTSLKKGVRRGEEGGKREHGR